MGSEYWEYIAEVKTDTPDVASVLVMHKERILPLTGDWDDITVAREAVPELFEVAQVPDDADMEFLEHIKRGTGYYELFFEDERLVSVRFFGFSCD